MLVVATTALWWAAPGAPDAIAIALTAFVAAAVATEIAAVFNNAMMPSLVPPERLGRLSGAGWAMGYAGGLVSLLVVLGFLAALPETGRTYFGLEPLFGLDPSTREGDRVTGPFSALWFLAFVWPLFLFTPDLPRTGLSFGEAVRHGLTQVRGTLADAKRHPGVLRFLLANMVYQDALVALFAFGGIYGAGVFRWGPVELGIFGILLTITGTVGALIGGRLDDRVSAKAVLLGAIALFTLVCIGIAVARARPHPVRRPDRAGRPRRRSLREPARKAVPRPRPRDRRTRRPAPSVVALLSRPPRPAKRGGTLFRSSCAVGETHVVPGAARGGDCDRRFRLAGGRPRGADPVLRNRRGAPQRSPASVRHYPKVTAVPLALTIIMLSPCPSEP